MRGLARRLVYLTFLSLFNKPEKISIHRFIDWGFIRSNETEEELKIRINQKWDDKDKVQFTYVEE